MGGQLSKRPSMRRDTEGNGGGATRYSAAQTGIQQYTAELSSYGEACRLYPELQSFDATVQQRTSRAIYTLAQGVEIGSLSFDALREITDGILETNQEVVRFLLECKKDIWKNPELFDLVDDYLNCSIQTLDYCTEIERCLKKARDSQLIIHFALQRFEEEEDEAESREDDKTKYIETLKKLRQFKAAGNPFTEEFSQVFHSVYTMQQSMLEKLLLRKRKLDRKLKSVKAWRKVSNMIFVAALAAFIICSIVAAAIAAPPVAAALAAASAIPVGSLGKWVGSLLKRHQDALVEEKELLSWMQIGTCVALKDLDTLRLLVDKLEIHFNSLLENADFALRDEEAVKFAVEEIKKQMELFMNNIEDLGKQVDQCSRYIRKARTVVLQRIMMHPHPHPHPK